MQSCHPHFLFGKSRSAHGSPRTVLVSSGVTGARKQAQGLQGPVNAGQAYAARRCKFSPGRELNKTSNTQVAPAWLLQPSRSSSYASLLHPTAALRQPVPLICRRTANTTGQRSAHLPLWHRQLLTGVRATGCRARDTAVHQKLALETTETLQVSRFSTFPNQLLPTHNRTLRWMNPAPRLCGGAGPRGSHQVWGSKTKDT